MAAHTHATAVQQLPALPLYTADGEGKQATDDDFERWIERFKERTKAAGQNKEHQLYQLKVHLDHADSQWCLLYVTRN